MQIVSCSVFLDGDRNHMVRKDNVTAAELVVLQHIHGAGSVIDIQRTRMDRRSHQEERARLRTLYKPKTVDEIYPNRPGMKLPVTLDEAGIGVEGAIDDAEEALDEEVQEPAKPKRRTSRSKPKVKADDNAGTDQNAGEGEGDAESASDVLGNPEG